MTSPRVGLAYEEDYFWHEWLLDFGPFVEPGFQFETPEPRRRMLSLLRKIGLTDLTQWLRASDITHADLLRVHRAEYVDMIEAANEMGGYAGEFTPFGPGGYDIARLSAGGVHASVDAVVSGSVDRAFALVRPPGHHAERDTGRGYCIFANIPVAIEKVRAERGLTRVAVVDWDVHHGNGTQWIYYDDPDTLTISIHQDALYPDDSGTIGERGGPGALGSCINIPLPAGSGRGAYLYAWDEVVAPAVRRFDPDLIVIACGFDASGFDPNARMLLSSNTFRVLTRRAIDLAEQTCGGRLVMAQEGGYSPLYVPLCGAAVVEELLECEPRFDDPGAYLDDLPDQALASHQQERVERAKSGLDGDLA